MGVPGLDVSSISVGWFSQRNFILFESSNKMKRYFVSGLATTQLLYKYYRYFYSLYDLKKGFFFNVK